MAGSILSSLFFTASTARFAMPSHLTYLVVAAGGDRAQVEIGHHTRYVSVVAGSLSARTMTLRQVLGCRRRTRFVGAHAAAQLAKPSVNGRPSGIERERERGRERETERDRGNGCEATIACRNYVQEKTSVLLSSAGKRPVGSRSPLRRDHRLDDVAGPGANPEAHLVGILALQQPLGLQRLLDRHAGVVAHHALELPGLFLRILAG